MRCKRSIPWGLCLLMLAGGPCLAASYTWVGGVSNSWHDPNNWSPAGDPNRVDDVLIAVSSPYPPPYAPFLEPYMWLTWEISGGGSITCTGPNTILSVNLAFKDTALLGGWASVHAGDATLTINNGARVELTSTFASSGDYYVQIAAVDGNSLVELSGKGSAFNAQGLSHLEIGGGTSRGLGVPRGELRILAGARVTAWDTTIDGNTGAGGRAAVLVDGMDSNTGVRSLLKLYGPCEVLDGSLTISNGGDLECGYYLAVGSADGLDPNALASVLIDGSNVDVVDAYIGYLGRGVLTVQGGGAFGPATGDVEIGSWEEGDGKAVVTGDGSLLGTLYTTVTVANRGKGALEVRQGGVAYAEHLRIGVRSTQASVLLTDANSRIDYKHSLQQSGGWLAVVNGAELKGYYPPSTPPGGPFVDVIGGVLGTAPAEATVSGPGSQWTNTYGTLEITPHLGQGRLTISSGGEVSFGTVVVGKTSWGFATVEGNDSLLFVQGQLTIADEGLADVDVYSGGRIWCGSAQLAAQPGSGALVTVSGAGTLLKSTGSLIVGGTDSNCGGTAGLGVGYGAAIEVLGDVKVWNDGHLLVSQNALMTAQGSQFMVDGELRVETGGQLSSTSAGVSAKSGSAGTVNVVGPNSLWTVGQDMFIGGELPGYTGYGSVGVGGGAKLQLGRTLTVGRYGVGELDVTGGSQVDCNRVAIALDTSSIGNAYVTGQGSQLTVNQYLYVGGSSAGPGGAGSLSVTQAGQVVVGQGMYVWGNGTVTVDSLSSITIQGEKLTLANHAKYLAETGAKILLMGTSVEIEGTDANDLAGLGRGTLVFAGGAGVEDSLETCGAERGDDWTAFWRNFAIGRLEIGTATTPGHVRLADAIANSAVGADPPPEALYVKKLVIQPGSSLDLGGLNVFALECVDQAGGLNYGGGSLTEVGAIQRVEANQLQVRHAHVEVSWVLEANCPADMVVGSALRELTYGQCTATLKACLLEDQSAGGLAKGQFCDVSLALYDANGRRLMAGTLAELVIREIADGTGRMSATGLLDLEQGVCLEDGLALSCNQTAQLDLLIEGVDVASFLEGFEGRLSLALTPVPEPATLWLLAAGLLLAARRRR